MQQLSLNLQDMYHFEETDALHDSSKFQWNAPVIQCSESVVWLLNGVLQIFKLLSHLWPWRSAEASSRSLADFLSDKNQIESGGS